MCVWVCVCLCMSWGYSKASSQTTACRLVNLHRWQMFCTGHLPLNANEQTHTHTHTDRLTQHIAWGDCINVREVCLLTSRALSSALSTSHTTYMCVYLLMHISIPVCVFLSVSMVLCVFVYVKLFTSCLSVTGGKTQKFKNSRCSSVDQNETCCAWSIFLILRSVW